MIEGRVVVMLSGGRDSVCLLDMAVRPGAEVTALHVNYGLRAEADGDEAFCRELCAAAGRAVARRAGGRAGRERAGLGARRPLRRGARARRDDPRPATPRPTRPRRSSTGCSPAGRWSGCRSASGRVYRPLLGMTRGADDRVLRRARAAVARGRDQRAIRRAGGSGRCWSCTRRAEANVLRALEGGRLAELATHGGTASLDLPGGLQAVSEYGRVTIGPPASIGLTVPGPGRVRRGRGRVRGRARSRSPTGRSTGWPSTLEVRTWRPGDRMRPLGLGGTKSLQDLFTDRKIPRRVRATAAGRRLRRRDRVGARRRDRRALPGAGRNGSDTAQL